MTAPRLQLVQHSSLGPLGRKYVHSPQEYSQNKITDISRQESYTTHDNFFIMLQKSLVLETIKISWCKHHSGT